MKKLEYSLEIDKLTADIGLKEAELAQNKELTIAKIAQDALDAIARTGSQLAGSAMSAMNVQAGLTQSSSCGEQYDYNFTCESEC